MVKNANEKKSFQSGLAIITRPPPNPPAKHKPSAPFQSLNTLIWFSIHTLPISIITSTLTFVVHWGAFITISAVPFYIRCGGCRDDDFTYNNDG